MKNQGPILVYLIGLRLLPAACEILMHQQKREPPEVEKKLMSKAKQENDDGHGSASAHRHNRKIEK